MLKRIVVLLFALAGLTKRLAGLSCPVRTLVLAILRSAEAVARDFVVETALDRGAPLPAVLDAQRDSGTAADAVRLAQGFRVLAVLLDIAADRDCGRDKCSIAPGAMIGRLLAARSLELERLFPAAGRRAVERRDSP